MKQIPELEVATEVIDKYMWFDFYCDKYLEGKITMEALHALYQYRLERLSE
jgi:hypothetical protein